MAKTMKKSQILRHTIQLIMFLVLPGLYAMTFSEVRTVYEMIIKGNFNFLQAFPSLVEFTVSMLLTILMGRWFCGWLCAFGAYNDLIYFISRKVFKVRFKVDEKVDSILKYTKYVVLLFIIIISWTIESSILESTSPWDAFGEITDFSTVFSSLLIGLIFLVFITIGAAFIERFFCRYLCPLGAIFSIISRIGMVKINKPKADCGKCRACTINCSMGLKLYKVDGAKGGDCINCLKCTEVCPRRNANINILGQDLNQSLAGSVAMTAILGVYGLTNFGASALSKSGVIASDSAISSDATQYSSVSDSSSQKYKDGTYTGSGEGFRGGITKVSVTVSGGKITDIKTISNGDTPKFYQRVEGTIINSIISKQSPSVDTISGATFSSKGIMSAVENALSQAVNSDSDNSTSVKASESQEQATSPKTSENKDQAVASSQTDNQKNTVSNQASDSKVSTKTDSSAKSEVTAQTSTGTQKNSTSNSTTTQGSGSTNNSTNAKTSTSTNQYKDGTYTGSGKGFKGGTTKISVTVSGGKISNIQTISNGDTPDYYRRASGTVINSIISKQSTSVDTVSGATYSSKGIMSAVENALSQAK